jgi:uncharacterized membrane protein
MLNRLPNRWNLEWRSLPHHQLTAANVLPMFDGVFAVAITLLASSLPNSLDAMNDAGQLLFPILSFELVGIAVLLYWFKLRRLILMARSLFVPQLLLGVFALLTIVVMPKLASLVIYYGNGNGSLLNWTLSQQVNVSFLVALFFFDGLTMLFALSLRNHPVRSGGSRQELAIALQAQVFGFGVLLLLAIMELFLVWFNNEFVGLVPLVLVAEEAFVAHRFARRPMMD